MKKHKLFDMNALSEYLHSHLRLKSKLHDNVQLFENDNDDSDSEFDLDSDDDELYQFSVSYILIMTLDKVSVFFSMHVFVKLSSSSHVAKCEGNYERLVRIR